MFKLFKSNGSYWCDNYDCKRLPKYISTRGHIKNGTLALCFGRYTFCFDCIDAVLEEAKLKLNKSLWAFK